MRNRFVLSGFYDLPFKRNRLVSGWQLGIVSQAQSGSPLTPLLTINTGTGTTLTVRPNQLQHVTPTGNPHEFYNNTVLCEPFNGTPTGTAPTIANCATTPNAAFAVPCTFSDVPTTPGSNNYPVIPGSCTPGDMQRDGLRGPDFINTDFSVVKNTKITEKVNLQFRTEFFDIFNHPNFGNPNNSATAASFGQVTSTRFPAGDFGSAREIQFALKLTF